MPEPAASASAKAPALLHLLHLRPLHRHQPGIHWCVCGNEPNKRSGLETLPHSGRRCRGRRPRRPCRLWPWSLPGPSWALGPPWALGSGPSLASGLSLGLGPILMQPYPAHPESPCCHTSVFYIQSLIKHRDTFRNAVKNSKAKASCRRPVWTIGRCDCSGDFQGSLEAAWLHQVDYVNTWVILVSYFG